MSSTTIKQELPAMEDYEQNVAEAETVILGTVAEVISWRDGPAHSDVPPSQVHILIRPVPAVVVALRLKSARALDELVGVLLEHRREVWP